MPRPVACGRPSKAFVVSCNEAGLLSVKSRCEDLAGFVSFERVGPGRATVVFRRQTHAEAAAACVLASLSMVRVEFCCDAKISALEANAGMARIEQLELQYGRENRRQVGRTAALDDEVVGLKKKLVHLRQSSARVKRETQTLREEFRGLDSQLHEKVSELEAKLSEATRQLEDARARPVDDLAIALDALVELVCDFGLERRVHFCGSLVRCGSPQMLAVVMAWEPLRRLLEHSGHCRRCEVKPHAQHLPPAEVTGTALRAADGADVVILPLRVGDDAGAVWNDHAARVSTGDLSLLTVVTGVCIENGNVEAIRGPVVGAGESDVFAVRAVSGLGEAGWGVFAERELVGVASPVDLRERAEQWDASADALRKALGASAVPERIRHVRTVRQQVSEAARRDAKSVLQTVVTGATAVHRIMMNPIPVHFMRGGRAVRTRTGARKASRVRTGTC